MPLGGDLGVVVQLPRCLLLSFVVLDYAQCERLPRAKRPFLRHAHVRGTYVHYSKSGAKGPNCI